MFNIPSSPHLICPQCENFNATLHSTMTAWEQFLLFMSTFLIIPFLFLARHYKHRDEARFFQGKNQATCRVCGYTFTIQQVNQLPLDMAKKQFSYFIKDIQTIDPKDINLRLSGISRG